MLKHRETLTAIIIGITTLGVAMNIHVSAVRADSIAFGGITYQRGNAVNSVTGTSPAVSGSDTYGVVTINHGNGDKAYTVAKWGEKDMTLLKTSYDSTFSIKTYIFGVDSPASSTSVVSVTFDSGVVYADMFMAYYTGVATSSHSAPTVTGQTTTPSLGIDTSAAPSTDNCWAVATLQNRANDVATAGTGSYSRATGSNGAFFDTNGAITPAGSHTMNFNTANSSIATIAAISLCPG